MRKYLGFVRVIPALCEIKTLFFFFFIPPFSFVSQSSSSGNPSLHGSMSSSADFSDEDDYSVKSGSASPAPGDTLPWNLPRHERSKRKIHGGSVLDPAERAVLRIAGEEQSPCCRLQLSVATSCIETKRRAITYGAFIHDLIVTVFLYCLFYVGSERGVVVMWICGTCDGILVMPSNYMLIRYVVHFLRS